MPGEKNKQVIGQERAEGDEGEDKLVGDCGERSTTSGIRPETVRHDHFRHSINNANLQLMNTIKITQSEHLTKLMNDSEY